MNQTKNAVNFAIIFHKISTIKRPRRPSRADGDNHIINNTKTDEKAFRALAPRPGSAGTPARRVEKLPMSNLV
nr:MAG TPA: hypothetical protein [Caudoviricetes sp.]